jgi:hypothetical protein
MLGELTFAKARALTIEHLSLTSLGESLGIKLTNIYSPRGPISVIVSATDCLFNYPSLKSFSRLGKTKFARF